eukprot:Hpha_TRINITY_DN18900_c0_g1::TRINITY_DN18900_c0_g1_i1::g.17510::m.17510
MASPSWACLQQPRRTGWRSCCGVCVGQSLIVMGGHPSTPDAAVELFVLDFDALRWLRAETSPGGPPSGAAFLGGAVVTSSAVAVLWASGEDRVVSMLDTKTWSWSRFQGVSLCGRLSAGLSFTGSGEGCVLAYGVGGGHTPTASSLVHTWKGDGWGMKRDISGCPRGRLQHASCTAPSGTVAIHGGAAPASGGSLLGDLWVCDLQRGCWSLLDDGSCAPAPCPRRLHAMAASEHMIVLHGGADVDGRTLDDLWTWEVSDHRWRGPLRVEGSVPQPRSGHLLSLVWPPLQPSSRGGPPQSDAPYKTSYSTGEVCFLLYGGSATPGGEQLHDVHRLLLPVRPPGVRSDTARSPRSLSATSGDAFSTPPRTAVGTAKPEPTPTHPLVEAAAAALAELEQERADQQQRWKLVQSEQQRVLEMMSEVNQAATKAEAARAEQDRKLEEEKLALEAQRREVERQASLLTAELLVVHSAQAQSARPNLGPSPPFAAQQARPIPGPSPPVTALHQPPPRAADPLTPAPRSPGADLPPRRASRSPVPYPIARPVLGPLGGAETAGSTRRVSHTASGTHTVSGTPDHWAKNYAPPNPDQSPVSAQPPSAPVTAPPTAPLPSTTGRDPHVNRLEAALAAERARVGELLLELDLMRRGQPGSDSHRNATQASTPASNPAPAASSISQPAPAWPRTPAQGQAEQTFTSAPAPRENSPSWAPASMPPAPDVSLQRSHQRSQHEEMRDRIVRPIPGRPGGVERPRSVASSSGASEAGRATPGRSGDHRSYPLSHPSVPAPPSGSDVSAPGGRSDGRGSAASADVESGSRWAVPTRARNITPPRPQSPRPGWRKGDRRQ